MHSIQPVLLVRPGDAAMSGSIASLPVSTHGYLCVDLGTEWQAYSLVQAIINLAGPMTTATATFYGADSLMQAGAQDVATARLLGIPGSSTPTQAKFAAINPANGQQAVWLRPAGRFILVDVLNADSTNAGGAASRIDFVAYPAC
jgi:hypothetical protein